MMRLGYESERFGILDRRFTAITFNPTSRNCSTRVDNLAAPVPSCSDNALVPSDTRVQHFITRPLPPIQFRKNLDFTEPLVARQIHPAANLLESYHAVAHHAAVVQQVALLGERSLSPHPASGESAQAMWASPAPCRAAPCPSPRPRPAPATTGAGGRQSSHPNPRRIAATGQTRRAGWPPHGRLSRRCG